MKFNMAVLMFLILASCQPKEKTDKTNYTDLVSSIDNIVSTNNFNGVIVLAKDTFLLYSKATGYSDIESKTLIDLNSQFVIGSISKQITAVLILKEYEKGRIKLDDKISDYLDDIEQNWSKKVSIHHLLTHTHGIEALDKPLEFEPESQFKYSQLGYDLLAQILEKVTNKSFQELSTDLFQANGLLNSFHPENKEYKSLVKGYEEQENGGLEFSPYSLYNYPAAGSFISNAGDLIKWNRLLHSEKLVNKETLDKMKKRYATREHPIFETVEYGYGLLFKDGEEAIQIGALGYAPGFVSAAYYYPKTDMNLVVLGNTARGLDDFKKTFKVHLDVMDIVKKTK